MMQGCAPSVYAEKAMSSVSHSEKIRLPLHMWNWPPCSPSETCTSHESSLFGAHGNDVAAGGLDSPPEHSFYKLKVMQQDGTMRDARGLYEWIQQFCIEQCALLIGMQEKGVKVDLSEWGDMEACALAVADRFDSRGHQSAPAPQAQSPPPPR